MNKKGLYNNEMKLYLLLFLVATLGGAVRKWFTDSALFSNLILLAQMMIPFLIYLYRSANSVSPFQKFPLLYIYYAYLIFHVIYPLQLTLFHGIFGIIIHGGFWLLIFYYIANRHLFNPRSLMKIFIGIGILEVVLAFVQYSLPTDHFLNRYANMDIIKNIATVGDRARITGTFSFLSGYTAYLLFASMLIWAMIRLKIQPWIVITATICCTITGFMTGSRSATVMNILILLPVFVQEYSLKIVTSVLGKLIIPLMLVVMVALVSKKFPLVDQASQAYENFMDRVETNRKSGEEANRLTVDLWFIQNLNFKYPIFGVGLGSTYQGAQYLFGTSPYVQEFGYAESEIVRVLLEGGIIMVAFKLILCLVMINKLMFKGLLKWVVFFSVYLFNPIVFNVHNAAFLALGIILVDNIIWQQQRTMLEKENNESEKEISQTELNLAQ